MYDNAGVGVTEADDGIRWLAEKCKIAKCVNTADCVNPETRYSEHADIMVGQRFDRLIVMDCTKRKEVHCKCDCGKEVVVTASNLLRGNTKSCGCLNRDLVRARSDARIVDLTGQRFGMLTVIERAEYHVGSDGKKQLTWRCRCDCGSMVDIVGSGLKHGRKSCGCLRKKQSDYPKDSPTYQQKVRRSWAEDLTGRQFGQLTVVSRAEDYVTKKGERQPRWLCKCECGNFTYNTTSGLKHNQIKKCRSCSNIRTAYRRAHGELPDDYVVTALDGNPFNTAANNLVAIPNQEYRLLLSRGWNSKGNADLKLVAIQTVALEQAVTKMEDNL